ncbi:hypothetical protein HDV00_004704 [Rhizophlyctis rosea]|nr:hypothetical protein HDV00_004704 [Rhizophlyctis rosea]
MTDKGTAQYKPCPNSTATQSATKGGIRLSYSSTSPRPSRTFRTGHYRPHACPRVDVSSTEDSYTVEVDLPGLSKDAVEIHVKPINVLAISREREEAKEETGERFYRKKGSYGKLERRVRSPITIVWLCSLSW